MTAGLLLVLTEAGGDRARAAIETAAAAAALGRPVAVLLRGGAAAALRHGGMDPALALFDGLGAEIVCCQTAMAEQGVAAADLPAGVVPGGLVGFLAGREGWQILLG